MGDTDTFNLDTYFAGYAPKSLTNSAWLSVRLQVREVVGALEPETEGEAKNLLGSLTRYLARMCVEDAVHVSALTSDGIDRFVALERAAGAKDSTLGQISPCLRRLLRALGGSPASKRCRKVGTRPRFEPLNDSEWSIVRRVAEEAAMAGAAGLLDFLEAGEKCGFHSAQLRDLGWGSPEISALRAEVETHGGMRLELHRLRHRWLKDVLAAAEPLAEVVTRHGLTRRDLELGVQGFTASESTGALLRSA